MQDMGITQEELEECLELFDFSSDVKSREFDHNSGSGTVK